MQSLTPPARPVKTSQRRSKPRRTYRLDSPRGALPAYLTITEAGESTQYRVAKIPSAWGTGFQLVKVSGPETFAAYHVNLDTANPEKGKHTCECKGHLQWGHKTRCRHVAVLLANIAAGNTDGTPVRPVCPCGAPAVTGPVGGECQACADASADRAARRHDLEQDSL
jgi:hypothetical protein